MHAYEENAKKLPSSLAFLFGAIMEVLLPKWTLRDQASITAKPGSVLSVFTHLTTVLGCGTKSF